MMKKDSLLCFCFLLLGVINISSQNISGYILSNKDSDAIPANISLLSLDSIFIKGVSNLTDGYFTIQSIANGEYILKIESLGFTSSFLNANIDSENRDFGIIKLTEDSKILKEVVVTGEREISKIDRQVLLPSNLDLNTSSNAFELLNRMSLPEIRVDVTNRVISTVGGENVQLRINGVQAEVSEIVALPPEDILRIEVYNTLGVRYANENASAIVDVIVKRRNSGGYLMTNMLNAVTTGCGDNQISSKFNYKESEFGVLYSISYRDFNKYKSDGIIVFNSPTSSITQKKEGIDSPMQYQTHNINLSYNLSLTDTYIFNAVFKDVIFNGNYQYKNRIDYNNDYSTLSQRENKNKSNTPLLDLYFKYSFSKHKTLYANVVGTYIKTNENRRFYESDIDLEDDSFEVINKVKGNKYSIISELMYQHQLNKNIISNIGIKHIQGYTQNIYKGNATIDTYLKNSNTYGFLELQGKHNDLSYLIGIGLTRLWFGDKDISKSYIRFNPTLSVGYKFNSKISSKFSSSITSHTPSLSELSNVYQVLDKIQASIGNPNLKPHRRFDNKLSLNYSTDKLRSSNITMRYVFYKNPIAERIYWSNNKFVSTIENHTLLQQVEIYMSGNYSIIDNIWSIYLAGGFDYYFSKGREYRHHYRNYWGMLNTSAFYKNMYLTLSMSTRPDNRLWGEEVKYGQNWQQVEIGYKTQNFKLGIGISYPFKNAWRSGTSYLSDLKKGSTWTSIRNNGHMIQVALSWNFSYGKQHKKIQKRLHNADDDTGIRPF